MTRIDRYLIALVFFIAVVLWAYPRLARSDQPIFVRVQVDGKVVAEFPLRSPGFNTFEFAIRGGEATATLEIRDEKVRMIPMPREYCPEGICSHTGFIQLPGQAIVCVPNRIVVSLVGGESDFDVISR
ncbi:MAG: NusG domain II-containing protein [Bacillota bacterium]